MCTKYYISKMKDQKRWYIDTCSIVNHEHLLKFIEKKEILVDSNVKLYVINPVYQELNRLLYSLDEYKSKDARIGLSLVLHNQEIFEVEGLNERMDIDNAFADPDFYHLFSKSMETSQLFITDDIHSAHDINNHNLTRSFKNKKIYICSIDDRGELVRNTGTYEEKPETAIKIEKEIVIQEVEKEVIKTVQVEKKVYVKKEPSIFQTVGLPVLTGVGGIGVGYCFCHNRHRLYSALVNVGKAIKVLA